RFGKSRNVVVGIFDHQVAIQDRIGKRFSEGRHDGRPDGDVRHEVAVHHVHVEQRAAALERSFRVVAQPREVSGEYRRCEFNQRRVPYKSSLYSSVGARYNLSRLLTGSCSGEKPIEKTDYTR